LGRCRTARDFAERVLVPRAAARDAFQALPFEEKNALRVYLMSLRRVPRVIVP